MRPGRTGALVTVCMLLTMFALPLLSFTASAATTERLYLTGERHSDAFVCVTDPLDDAADALQPSNPDAAFEAGPLWDGNYWDGTPGFVYWGNVSSATVGTYGTAYIQLEVSDITTEGYWSVDAYMYAGLFHNLVPWTTAGGDGSGLTTSWDENLSISIGFGTVGDFPAEGWDATEWILGGTAGSPVESTATTHNFTNVENDDYSRPWSTDEINDGYLIIKLVFNEVVWSRLNAASQTDPPVSLGICSVRVQVQPEAYTPPTPPVIPVGSFILRPNLEVLNATFGAYPASMSDLADATNESTHFSDGDVTYAYGTFSGAIMDAESMSLGFDDPNPGYTFAHQFKVLPWVIMKTSTGMTVIVVASVYENTDPGTGVPWLMATATNSYTNYSATDFLVNPRTNSTWTLSELANIELSFLVTGVMATGQLRISQVAIIVSPCWSDGTSWDFSGMLQYLGGGMIPTLIGVMGFCMLIGVPSIAVLAYRSGESEGMMTVVHAAVLMVLGFGFFMVGLIGA